MDIKIFSNPLSHRLITVEHRATKRMVEAVQYLFNTLWAVCTVRWGCQKLGLDLVSGAERKYILPIDRKKNCHHYQKVWKAVAPPHNWLWLGLNLTSTRSQLVGISG